MALQDPYQTYRQQSAMTASPGDLTLMLYNGCIKFIRQGILGLEARDFSQANNAILRAQDIIAEFMSTLDMGYELSGNLMELYQFINSLLIEANIKKDGRRLEAALTLVSELRDTWAEVVRLNRRHA